MEIEITNISPAGIRLVLDGAEKFMSYDDFPWFRHATVSQIVNVERPSPNHLYWPDIDVDLHAESIDHPEKYPLRAKVVIPEPVVR